MRRFALLVVAALGFTLTPVVGTSPSASAAPSDVIAVVVEGTGLGHGRGMSQWGAYGYAVDQGWDWKRILNHYYGGTELADAPNAQARIRVRLLAFDGAGTVGVTAGVGNVSGGGQTARSLYAQDLGRNEFQMYASTSAACPTSSTLAVPDGTIQRPTPELPDPPDKTAVRQIQTFLNAFVGSNLTVDGIFGPITEGVLKTWQQQQGLPDDGVWNDQDASRARQQIESSGAGADWTKVGQPVTGPVKFANSNSENSGASPTSVLAVCNPVGGLTHYRGKVEFRSESDGSRVVNDVKTEDYLRGVVPKEISASWANAGGGKGVNAVRAQAVAARSYGLQQQRYGYASTCDSQSCQVYGGAATRSSPLGVPRLVEDARTDAAIEATAGKVRTWPDGEIVSTEFSASNGPRTAGGAFPPVNDIGDATPNNPNHKWARVIDADTLANRYGLGRITTAEMVETTTSNYRQFDGIWFNDVLLNGSKRIDAWTFRRAFGLPSPGFTVRVITEDTTAKKVAFIGDSVGRGVTQAGTSELRALTDGTFASISFDAVDSRCTTRTSCPGASGAEVADALPSGLDLVVVELGYNDDPSTFSSDIDAMMTALRSRGVGRVAWVNMADIRTRNERSYYAPANAALQAATSRWSNLTVLDWDAASRGPERPRWFSRDGVHLTTTGEARFSLWLRQRMLDLAPSHFLAPPKIIELPVAGQRLLAANGQQLNVPASATAVALNLTVVDPVARGYMTVWPCGVPRPVASNVNFLRGSRIANNVVAPVGAGGKVCIYAHAGTDVVVDVAGWFPGGAGDASFVGVTPLRVVDSRKGIGAPTRLVTPDAPLRIPVAGRTVTLPNGSAATVPDVVGAAAFNVTAVDPIAQGYLTVWPCDVRRPVASNLNFPPGARIANGVIAPVGAGGDVCLYAHEPTHVVVDLAGWFGTAGFSGVTPDRFIDSRDGTGGRLGRITPSSPITMPVRGQTVSVGGTDTVIPSDATAVALNLTIVDPFGRGYATVWPCGSARPTASNINFTPGKRIANGVVAPIGDDGSVCIYTHASTHVVVDVAGWFSGGASPGFVGATPERFIDTRIALGPAPR